MSEAPVQPESKPLMVEETVMVEGNELLKAEKIRTPGLFERIFHMKFFSVRCLAICCGVLIFAALIGVIGHLAQVTRVLIEQSKTIDGHGIDESLFNKFNLYEQYSAAAYCPQNHNSSHSKLVCGTGNCPLVEAADTSTEAEFER
jgi:hypothetical protein